MRAVCYASLVCGEPKGVAKLAELVAAESYQNEIYKNAVLGTSVQGSPPVVLDFFGGGGTIPFEAAAVGAKVYASDYNPLSVFIQYVNLVLSQKAFSKHGRSQVRDCLQEAGSRLLATVKKRTDPLYPLRKREEPGEVFGYYWTYTKRCGSCGSTISLQKRPWLSKKAGKTIFISSDFQNDISPWAIEHKGEPKSQNWSGRSGAVLCPNCGALEKGAQITQCEDALAAVGILTKPTGKRFEPARQCDAYPAASISAIRNELARKFGGLPETRLPRWSGIVNPALYGVKKHSDVLNPRQQTLLLTLIDELQNTAMNVERCFSREMADFVMGALAGLIDQVIDWNCRLSMWIPQNEQVGRAFCGPGIAMLWDYAETDQLGTGPANLWDKLSRIVNAVREIPQFSVIPVVSRGRAQRVELPDRSVDAVITDPPYYDNMFYNTLADFFYVWKRKAFLARFPDFFEIEQSEEEHELVASVKRRGSADVAHAWYCRELVKALSEAKRVLKDDGVLSFVYGHSSISGWSAVVTAFREAGLAIANVQPLSIERRARPRAMTSEAVNTCIVLVAQRAENCKNPLNEATDIAAPLVAFGWKTEDAGMAQFAFELCCLVNVKAELSQERVRSEVRQIADKVSTRFFGFKVTDRKPI